MKQHCSKEGDNRDIPFEACRIESEEMIAILSDRERGDYIQQQITWKGRSPSWTESVSINMPPSTSTRAASAITALSPPTTHQVRYKTIPKPSFMTDLVTGSINDAPSYPKANIA